MGKHLDRFQSPLAGRQETRLVRAHPSGTAAMEPRACNDPPKGARASDAPSPALPSAGCGAFHAALGDYFLGAGGEPERLVEEHARGCGPCGDFLRICRELSCREFVEFLDRYVADELPPERKAVFERHLRLCADCRRYLQSYLATVELGRAAFAESSAEWELAPAVPVELVEAILRARGP
jgi:hypothetical protein